MTISPSPLALQNSCDPILLIDRKRQITWCNSAARHFLGVEGPGIPLNDLLLPEEATAIKFEGPICCVEVRVKSSSGSAVKQLAVVLDLSASEPDSQLYLVVFKSTDNPLASSAKQHEFLATAAHDLKNPLGAIFGFADALLDTSIGTGLTGKQREVLSRIRNTAMRSIDLVRNYQHLADLESGRHSTQRGFCDMNLIIRTVIEASWRDDKGFPSLSLDLAPEILAVQVEKIQLDRVVANLFSNALHYTPSSERISIKTFLQDDTAFLQINNGGSLIPPEELPYIFDRYRRASTSTGVMGSGLGLYITQQIVSSNGGKISVESTAAGGTTFTVELPAARHDAGKKKSAADTLKSLLAP